MSHRILANRYLAGAIKREEIDDTTVIYRNMSLLDRGVWTDAGSGKPTEYDPAELEVSEQAPVNIMHDSESEASRAGYIEADSWTVESGTGYADVVLDLSTAAGQYADENLQEALESGGEVGFGGPSIEIPANAYDLEDTGNAYPKLVNGRIEGMGFVKDPASKSTSFARQTAERGVAMSEGGEDSIGVWLKDGGMSDKTLQVGEEELSGIIGGAHQDAFDSITDLYEAADDAEAFGGGLSDILDNAQETILENAFGEGEEEEDVEAEEDDYEDKDKEEDDEEEEEDTEMGVDELASELAELRTEVEQIREEHEALMEADAVEEELSAVREELADADTVQELSEAKEELDKRLSKLEDEPKDPKSLADDGDTEDWYSADSGVSYDPASGSTSY